MRVVSRLANVLKNDHGGVKSNVRKVDAWLLLYSYARNDYKPNMGLSTSQHRTIAAVYQISTSRFGEQIEPSPIPYFHIISFNVCSTPR